MLTARIVLTLALLAGCDRGAETESSAPVSPVAANTGAAANPAARARTTIADSSGAIVAVLMPRSDGGGWRIEDATGTKLGSLRVTDDRVSAKDADDRRLGKAKRRDYGFKIEDGEDRTLLKVQHRDERYRLKRGDDEVIGHWIGPRIELASGVVIDTTQTGGRTTVRRAGVAVYTIEGPFEPQAALFLGLTEELSLEQRLAAMVFVREVRFP